MLQQAGATNAVVGNFGMPGTTLSRFSHNPWSDAERPVLRAALEFKPHIVVVCLGINDTGDFNWKKPGAPEAFIRSYIELLQSFEPGTRAVLCLPPRHLRSPESNANRADPQCGLDACIERVAAAHPEAEVLDLRDLPNFEAYCEHDGLHPDERGAEVIARMVMGKLREMNVLTYPDGYRPYSQTYSQTK